jgi:hypothetical protein
MESIRSSAHQIMGWIFLLRYCLCHTLSSRSALVVLMVSFRSRQFCSVLRVMCMSHSSSRHVRLGSINAAMRSSPPPGQPIPSVRLQGNLRLFSHPSLSPSALITRYTTSIDALARSVSKLISRFLSLLIPVGQIPSCQPSSGSTTNYFSSWECERKVTMTRPCSPSEGHSGRLSL